ncbi:GatB/YqeY domain-containing protein [Candidatus Microgenomates bacterium]|nr:GatB/YqeY domain-containing protein [Candidatus Microgenomates bacterium]
MGLQQKINQDLEQALRKQDQASISTLRLVKNSLDAAAKDKKADLTDTETIKIIQNEIKQRRESIASFEQGGRTDMVQKEQAEIKVLEQYLPEQLSADELAKIIEQVIAETGASSMGDMGKVMGVVTKKTAGRAEGSEVARLVREKLQG